MMKKLLVVLAFAILQNTLCVAQSALYKGKGGEGKVVLLDEPVMVNGLKNGSDKWLAQSVKTDVLSDLSQYSAMKLLESEQQKNVLKLQKESESAIYDDTDALEIGRMVKAREYIKLTITRIEQKGQNLYGLQATIVDIETGVSEGGYNPKSYYNQTEFLTKAHGELSAGVLEQMGVELTETGKRLITKANEMKATGGSTVNAQNIAVVSAKELKDAQDNLNAIDTELVRMQEKLEAIKNSDAFDLEKEAEKLRLEFAKTKDVFPPINTRHDFSEYRSGNRDNDKEVAAVMSVNAQLEQLKSLLDAFLVCTYFVLFVFLVIVMIGILNTYRVIVYERTREIGTMRAIGMQASDVKKIFLYEAAALALIASALGFVLGLVTFHFVGLFNLSRVTAAGMFTENGALQYGWKKLGDGRTVFYNRSTGRMVFGVQTIDGKKYRFNEVNGALIGEVPDTPTGDKVFWNTGGVHYHTTKSCSTLTIKDNMKSGTIAQAQAAGKTACPVCAKGNKVYWNAHGVNYHKSNTCSEIDPKYRDTMTSGTVAQAQAAGKSWCAVCKP